MVVFCFCDMEHTKNPVLVIEFSDPTRPLYVFLSACPLCFQGAPSGTDKVLTGSAGSVPGDLDN